MSRSTRMTSSPKVSDSALASLPNCASLSLSRSGDSAFSRSSIRWPRRNCGPEGARFDRACAHWSSDSPSAALNVASNSMIRVFEDASRSRDPRLGIARRAVPFQNGAQRMVDHRFDQADWVGK